MDEIEGRKRDRRTLLKALYKTRDSGRPIQDLAAVFEVAGLDADSGLDAARHLENAGLLKWESAQEPGIVRLLHPGIVAAERLITEERQAARTALLRRAYDATSGDSTKSFDHDEIGAQIGLDDDEIQAALAYLVDSGLIRRETFTQSSITTEGIKEVEQSRADEQRPTATSPRLRPATRSSSRAASTHPSNCSKDRLEPPSSSALKVSLSTSLEPSLRTIDSNYEHTRFTKPQ